MTDREKAIVMAYTGVTMLTGDKLGIFYKYIEKLLGHPVMTHELADQDIQDKITQKSKEDFIALCRDNSTVPLDKLCEWLEGAEKEGLSCLECADLLRNKSFVTKWMEEQDATD